MAEPDVYVFGGRSRVAVRLVLAYKILRHGSRRFRLPGSEQPVVMVCLKAREVATVDTCQDPPRKDYGPRLIVRGYALSQRAADLGYTPAELGLLDG